MKKFGEPGSDDANKKALDFMMKIAIMYAGNKITQPQLYPTRNNELQALGLGNPKPRVAGSAAPVAKVARRDTA